MQASSDLSLLSLIGHASFPVQVIMLLLFTASVLSWTFIFSKRAALRRAADQTRRFEDDFWAGGDLTVLQQAIASRRNEHGALARSISNHQWPSCFAVPDSGFEGEFPGKRQRRANRQRTVEERVRSGCEGDAKRPHRQS